GVVEKLEEVVGGAGDALVVEVVRRQPHDPVAFLRLEIERPGARVVAAVVVALRLLLGAVGQDVVLDQACPAVNDPALVDAQGPPSPVRYTPVNVPDSSP